MSYLGSKPEDSPQTLNNEFFGLTTVTGTLKVSTGAAVGGVTPGIGGLAFPSSTVAVTDPNTLDDYEEGTFTPIVSDAISAGNNAASYGTQKGRYTKIGRICVFNISLTNISTVGMTAGNQVFITGLPFARYTDTNTRMIFPVQIASGTPTTGSVLATYKTDAATQMSLVDGNTTGSAAFLISQLTSGTANIYISGCYETA